ncbi:unnamed protein product [Meganyctiphanes norvegica]|uniref:EF-hand domain-containing protein n=1 Tax=Meganyctiphanes norvegica TaxID=48144 RepID=A0AAV2RA49_MEGNR
MSDLSAKEKEIVKFAFSIYDFEGKNEVDGVYLGDVLRAVNLNPTDKQVAEQGGTVRKKDKFFKVDEFFKMFSEIKKDKDSGSYEDFMELLLTYDKMEDGHVVLTELEYILNNLGERLEKYEVDGVIAELCPEPDDDDMVEYEPFVMKLTKGLKK